MPLHIEIVECLNYASPTVVTVGVASGAVIVANDSRKYLRITNIGAAAIYLAFGTTALINKGVYVAKEGGIFEMTIENLTNEAVNGISGGAGNTVLVQEAT